MELMTRAPTGDPNDFRADRARVPAGEPCARRILARVADRAHPSESEEPWADPGLTTHLGQRGAAAFAAMFDAFPEAVGLLWAIRDDAGRIVDFDFGYGNPAIMRMFRLPGTQAGRYTVLQALPQMREDGTFDRYARVCDTGEPWVDEVSFDTPFGDGYIRGTFLRRTARLGDGLIVLMTDVTDQRRMEAELRGFADMVAHDLREPITGIAHLVTLLERRHETPPDPEVLDLMRASTERARGLIDGVLAYARAGELELAPVALGTLMAEVAEDLRPRLDAAGATLDVGELPEVRGDARQLRRLLQNLVANAVKFRGERPPRVKVSAHAGREGWVIGVEDNGVGIAAHDAARIFGMFARASGDHEGTGIGLAVCRRVVEAHGGQIWVEPANGGGSVFRFTLPR
jgi:signal transduction histidine kinase